MATAARIMVRRVNALDVNGKRLTKNLYRRTWHQGGVSEYDVELPPGDARQRLTVALVQKQVSDLVGTRFGNSVPDGDAGVIRELRADGDAVTR